MLEAGKFYLDEHGHLYKVDRILESVAYVTSLANGLELQFDARIGKHLNKPVRWFVEEVKPIKPILGERYMMNNGLCVKITDTEGGCWVDDEYLQFNEYGFCPTSGNYLTENVG